MEFGIYDVTAIFYKGNNSGEKVSISLIWKPVSQFILPPGGNLSRGAR